MSYAREAWLRERLKELYEILDGPYKLREQDMSDIYEEIRRLEMELWDL